MNLEIALNFDILHDLPCFHACGTLMLKNFYVKTVKRHTLDLKQLHWSLLEAVVHDC